MLKEKARVQIRGFERKAIRGQGMRVCQFGVSCYFVTHCFYNKKATRDEKSLAEMCYLTIIHEYIQFMYLHVYMCVCMHLHISCTLFLLTTKRPKESNQQTDDKWDTLRDLRRKTNTRKSVHTAAVHATAIR